VIWPLVPQRRPALTDRRLIAEGLGMSKEGRDTLPAVLPTA